MVLDNEATGVMADALSTRLAEIRARLAQATPVNGFCDQHKYLAVICPMCAANMFPDAVFLLDTLEAALQVVEAARAANEFNREWVVKLQRDDHMVTLDHKDEMELADLVVSLIDTLTTFSQHTKAA